MILTYSNQELYNRQTEVAKLCKVSEAAITKWVNNAKEEKNLLQLTQKGNRFYIIRNEHNAAELARLAKEAEVFQKVDYVDIYPSEELYEIMTDDQITSLISSLKINKVIPQKYTYLGNGANYWDEFYNTVNETKDLQMKQYGIASYKYLFNKTFSFLEGYFSEFDIVNFIDLGCGNFKPVFDAIKDLYKAKKLGKYIAVDISKRMIEIAKENFIANFPETYFDSAVIDIELDSLQNILFKSKEHRSKRVLNIIVSLGCTIGNVESQTQVLQNIKNGMFAEDILVIDNLFDVHTLRSDFPTLGKPLRDKQVLHITRLLNIAEELYEKEIWYNPENKHREYNLIMKKAIRINFRDNKTLTLSSSDKLNVYKSRNDTFEYIAEKMSIGNLSLQSVTRHPTAQQVIYVAKVNVA